MSTPTHPPQPNSRSQTVRLGSEGDYVEIWLPGGMDWIQVYGNGYVSTSLTDSKES